MKRILNARCLSPKADVGCLVCESVDSDRREERELVFV